jgi:hypothetical protein
MAIYCDPSSVAREWHDADNWDSPIRGKADKFDLAKLMVRPRAESRTESIEIKFKRQVDAWREATENLSSITSIVANPAYQRIIDLGKPVLPFVFKEFQQRGGYWATALQSITGENPVIPKHIGNRDKVREDWLRWGSQRGYI